jgi:hypothetical protein
MFVESEQPSDLVTCLVANANCLILDYILRQKMGGSNLAFHVLRQLPFLGPDRFGPEDLSFLIPRVLELSCTAWSMQVLADQLWIEADDPLREHFERRWHENAKLRQKEPSPPPTWFNSSKNSFPFCPFYWNSVGRHNIRSELDAYFAQLYGLTRSEMMYVLDPRQVVGDDFPSETFRVLKEREEKEFGEYRTQRLVLAAFDEMSMSDRFHGQKRECTITGKSWTVGD